MRFLFVVQGEGRGHMTQAISLRQMLEGQGHHVCAVCVGRGTEARVRNFVPGLTAARRFIPNCLQT